MLALFDNDPLCSRVTITSTLVQLQISSVKGHLIRLIGGLSHHDKHPNFPETLYTPCSSHIPCYFEAL